MILTTSYDVWSQVEVEIRVLRGGPFRSKLNESIYGLVSKMTKM